jgi:hypothetical protein
MLVASSRPANRCRQLIACAVAGMVVLCAPSSAGAATPESCPQSVQDRHEAGDKVTVVGYTGGCRHLPEEVAGNDDRPLYGYLLDEGFIDRYGPVEGSPPGEVDELAREGALGQFTVADTGHGQEGRRVSLTFRLPEDLPSGTYFVGICQDPCTRLLRPGAGPRIGTQGWPSWPIYVGVDPPDPRQLVRDWPLDDPAIADLPNSAFVRDTDGSIVTAAELRAPETGDSEGSGRAAAIAPPGRDDGPHLSDTQAAFGLAAAALTVIAWWITRLGPTRKRVRQGADHVPVDGRGDEA